MANTKKGRLRIYCICGQKMKVSRSMYGLPGKCVACRQKIRIPRKDEISPGTKEIYLKDHPELLRKPAPPGVSPPVEQAQPAEAEPSVRPESERPEEVAPGEEREADRSVPLDVLEPLRTLCSLDKKLRRQLEALEESRDSGTAGGEADEERNLAAYGRRIQAARAELDEFLRQRLMEVAIELATVQEKLAQADLGVRVGEISFADYRDTTDRLRRRRDHLERRQQNLRGWLAVKDPYMAGGYADLSFDRIPKEGFAITIPSKPERKESLVSVHIDGLHQAFRRRQRAERRLSEIEESQTEENLLPAGLRDMLEDCQAERRCADAEVAFVRGRLAQLAQDCKADLKAVSAQRDLARGRLQVGEIDRAHFEVFERELLQAKADVTKAQDVVTRSLSASRPEDLPPLRGTFLERLAKPREQKAIGVDSWVAWSAACLLAASLSLPALGHLSPWTAFRQIAEAASAARWAVAGLFVVAVAVAFAGAIPARALRGWVLGALWLAVTLAFTVFVHEARYSVSLAEAGLKPGGVWFLRPAGAAFLLADLGLLAAAGLALVSEKKSLLALPVAMVLGLIFVALVATDFAGTVVAKPSINVEESEGPKPDYDVNITVGNRGGRTLLLASSQVNVPNAYLFAVEERIGHDSWEDVPIPWSKTVNDAYRGTGVRAAIPPGKVENFVIGLAPGSYHALVKSPTADEEIAWEFVLPAPSEPPAPQEPARLEGDEVDELERPDETAEPEEEAYQLQSGVSVELKGVVSTEGKAPQFSFVLHLPYRTETSRVMSLGDTLHGAWTLREYNPMHQTVTIANGERILIVRRGQRTALDSAF